MPFITLIGELPVCLHQITRHVPTLCTEWHWEGKLFYFNNWKSIWSQNQWSSYFLTALYMFFKMHLLLLLGQSSWLKSTAFRCKWEFEVHFHTSKYSKNIAAQYTNIQEMFMECKTTLGFIYKKIQNASTFVFLRMSRSAWLFLIRNSKWRAMVVSPPKIATNLSTLSTSFLSLSLCDALKKKIRLQRIHFLSVLHVFVQLIYNILIAFLFLRGRNIFHDSN